jgi:hypothetical protein
MDPVTIGVAAVAAVKTGNTLVAGAKNVAAGGRFAARKLRQYGRFDAEWLELGLEGESLTASQVTDVHAFLASTRVQPVLRFVALSVLTPTSEGHADINQAMKALFRDEATRWLDTSSDNWGCAIDLLWERLEVVYQQFIRPIDDQSELFEEAENYTRFIGSPLGHPVNSSGLATTYLNRMTELAGDLELLVGAGSASAELAQLIQASGYGPIINHIDVSNARFQDLYVGRNFTEPERSDTVESEGLVSSENPFRIVLKGAPGAGKSTFVNHFVQAMASSGDDRPGAPSVVVRCREYAGNGWASSLTDYAVQKLKVGLAATFLTVPLMEAMLLTGQVVVVFDGLDEITDRTQRAEMVQRIQAFTAQYPPTSVLVTTRAVGYERAPVDSRLFRHLELQEFSSEQVADYANRWFMTAGRPELTGSFIRESETTVSDLRVNPLLLSLLCTLYKSGGEIPTNRREIYEECAQLLFKRWDAHRQIQVPHSMPNFANELMREIARWYYTNSSTQAGVEEQQISQAISTYMVDEIGMSLDDARAEAKEFLNFCADRAWLLGSPGSNDWGQRVYSFVHRTFFEFFAAEAFARAADASPSNVAARIREAFEKDATSVLPELLIQSYHSVKVRGATHVFEELCTMAPSPAPSILLLRLLDGAVLAKYALISGFTLLNTRWNAAQNGIPRSEFLALLSVNTVARKLFVDEFLLAQNGQTARKLFFASWSSHQLSGGRRFEGSWTDAVGEVTESFGQELSADTDENLINWLLIRRFDAGSSGYPWSYVRTVGTFGPADGFVWWAIRNAVSADFTEAQGAAINAVHRLVSHGYQVPNEMIDLWDQDAFFKPSPLLNWTGDSEDHVTKLRDILAVVLLAIHEENIEGGEMEASSACWPGQIRQVAALRDWQHGVGSEPSPEEKQEARVTLRVLPRVIQQWAKGGQYLLEDSKLA